MSPMRHSISNVNVHQTFSFKFEGPMRLSNMIRKFVGAQVCFSDSEGFSISNPNIRRTFSFKFDSPVSL